MELIIARGKTDVELIQSFRANAGAINTRIDILDVRFSFMADGTEILTIIYL